MFHVLARSNLLHLNYSKYILVVNTISVISTIWLWKTQKPYVQTVVEPLSLVCGFTAREPKSSLDDAHIILQIDYSKKSTEVEVLTYV